MINLWQVGVALAAAGAVLTGASTGSPSTGPSPSVTVYKSPTCGCCTKWVDHLRASGYTVTAKDVDDVDSIKADLGVPSALASCHTALVGGYVIEGHVPAADITRLLKEKPKVTGIAVPGMPMGSPGMEGPRKDAYEVVAFEANGSTQVFAKH